MLLLQSRRGWEVLEEGSNFEWYKEQEEREGREEKEEENERLRREKRGMRGEWKQGGSSRAWMKRRIKSSWGKGKRWRGRTVVVG